MGIIDRIVSNIVAANEKRRKAKEIKLFYEERKAMPWKNRAYDEKPYMDHVQVDGKGYLRIRDVTIGLKNEDYPPTPLAILVKEACKYPEEIYLEKFNEEVKRASCKDIVELLELELTDKDWVDLYIENKRDESKPVAIKLYAGLTTRGEIPNFNRLG